MRDRQAVLGAPSHSPYPTLLQDWVTNVQVPSLPRQGLILEQTPARRGSNCRACSHPGRGSDPFLARQETEAPGLVRAGKEPSGTCRPPEPPSPCLLPVNRSQHPLFPPGLEGWSCLPLLTLALAEIPGGGVAGRGPTH